jgi:hypothetical protein
MASYLLDYKTWETGCAVECDEKGRAVISIRWAT